MTPQNPQTVEASVSQPCNNLGLCVHYKECGRKGACAAESSIEKSFPIPSSPPPETAKGEGEWKEKMERVDEVLDALRQAYVEAADYESASKVRDAKVSIARLAPPDLTPPAPADKPSQGQGGEGRVRWFRRKDKPQWVWMLLPDGTGTHYDNGKEVCETSGTPEGVLSNSCMEEFFPDSPSTPTPEVQKPAWQARCSHPGCTNTVLNDGDKCRAHFVPQKPAEGQDIGLVSDEQGLRNIATDRNMKIPDWVRKHMLQSADTIARLRQENQTLREQLTATRTTHGGK